MVVHTGIAATLLTMVLCSCGGAAVPNPSARHTLAPPVTLGPLAIGQQPEEFEAWCRRHGGELWTERSEAPGCSVPGRNAPGTEAFCDGVVFSQAEIDRPTFVQVYFDAENEASRITVRFGPNHSRQEIRAIASDTVQRAADLSANIANHDTFVAMYFPNGVQMRLEWDPRPRWTELLLTAYPSHRLVCG